MKIGLQFPTREIKPVPSAIRLWVEMAREAGADYLMAPDHILGVVPEMQNEGWDKTWVHPSTHRARYDYKDRFHEPFVLLGFMAALCDLELATGVLVLPQRNTALVAKQAAEIDLLCEGKLRLGVGVGWNAAEFESIGERFANRGKRMSEQIALLRRYWTEDAVSFQGAFHSVHAAGIAPSPIQRPIPVWIGGASLVNGMEAVSGLLRRIGELGDGWCMDSATVPNAVTASAIELIRRVAHECGRDQTAIGFDARMYLLRLGESKFQEHLAQWQRLGATHLTLDLNGLEITNSSDAKAAIARIVGLAKRLNH